MIWTTAALAFTFFSLRTEAHSILSDEFRVELLAVFPTSPRESVGEKDSDGNLTVLPGVIDADAAAKHADHLFLKCGSDVVAREAPEMPDKIPL